MITYWHNPRCSKSRAGLALLQESGTAVSVRLYLQDPPSLTDIQQVQAALGVSAIAMMRQNDTAFKELDLGKDAPDAALQAAMAANPALIERPIAIAGERAVIGRPIEAINALL